MADKGDGRRRQAPARQRIKTLTQAALNADVTVEQVDTSCADLGQTLTDLDTSTSSLDVTLEPVQRHHHPHRRTGAAADRRRRTPRGHRRPGRTHRGRRRIGDGAVGARPRTRVRGARQRGAQEHRPVETTCRTTRRPAGRRRRRSAVGRRGRRRRGRDRGRRAPATATRSWCDSGGHHYLFTFSPTGVESFYALPEESASKGVADYLMLRRKLPDEIFAGRRTAAGFAVPPRRRRRPTWPTSTARSTPPRPSSGERAPSTCSP